MINAWKKLINKGQGFENGFPSSNGAMPPGVQKLDKDLQRKFARGVHYNMKVVIKGDNRVGKTSLFLRLKGYGFDDNYTPTESLNVTSIDWNYKATDDIVKIDLWEAIDTTSKKNVNFVDLKMENLIENMDGTNANNDVEPAPKTQSNIPDNLNSIVVVTSKPLSLSKGGRNSDPIPESAKQTLAELSANFNVYKGTDAVLLVMDMTKSWTFKYVQSEFPKIPDHMPVLVIANHRDQGHHRTITAEQVKAFLVSANSQSSNRIVMYTEASMKNGFGIKLIEKFFNIPFLKLQESSLLKQIELNRQEYLATQEELQLLQETTNRDYEQYLELETIKRRQQADAMSPVNNGLRQLDEETREQIRNSTMSCDTIDKNVKSIESNNNKPDAQCNNLSSKFVNDRLASIIIGAKCPLPETHKMFSESSNVVVHNNHNQQRPRQDATTSGGTTNEDAQGATIRSDQVDESGEESDDDDDEPRANPMVANYQSDVDSDDQIL